MRRILHLLFMVSSLCAQSSLETAAWEIAQQETSFSGFAFRNGIRAAFLEFLSDECVMFNPLPVNGKDLYRSLPERKNILTWQPDLVEIAASGDFGISTGPWEMRKHSHEPKPDGVGHYFSVWERMKEGEWKVTLDVGIGYPIGRKRERKLQVRVPVPGSRPSTPDESPESSVRTVESRLHKMIKEQSYRIAFDSFASESVRVYRKGEHPVDGKTEGGKLITIRGDRYSFFHHAVRVASSGDLGYTYGYAVSPQNDTSIYVRIWRKEQVWKMAVDLLTSIQ